MSEADELLKEHAEHAHSTFDRYVAVTMAILAVVLATDSLLGHRAHTEQLLNQAQASDQWAFYQAKAIRRSLYDVGGQLAGVSSAPSAANAQAVTAAFKADVARYEKEAAEIQTQARDFEKERDRYSRRADRYDFGEIFLEVSLVMCSLAILTKRRSMWVASLALAAVGAAIALSVIGLA